MRTPHLVLLLVVASALAAARPAGADPLGDARRKYEDVQSAAVAAVQRYSDALSEQARQDAEIARLEAEIPALRFRAAELKQMVQDRAVTLYRQGSSMPISRMVDAPSVLDGARAVQLTQSAASYGREVAAELTETAAKLERDETELRQRKVLQDALVTRLADERAALEHALAEAQEILQKVEAVVASQILFEGAPDFAASGRVPSGASICPIYGPVAFVNDWGAPRSGGRTHQGNDLFAPYGMPNLAVIDGTIRHDLDDLGGIGVWLDGDDGISYYYAHLSRWEGDPRRVVRGEVIGWVGDTGNAAGGPPHTHFGMRFNGEMVNPYPTLRVLCHQ
jgi:murein DD-endopeptidase MepM/ murein hydrolase activator NlpD